MIVTTYRVIVLTAGEAKLNWIKNPWAAQVERLPIPIEHAVSWGVGIIEKPNAAELNISITLAPKSRRLRSRDNLAQPPRNMM